MSQIRNITDCSPIKEGFTVFWDPLSLRDLKLQKHCYLTLIMSKIKYEGFLKLGESNLTLYIAKSPS